MLLYSGPERRLNTTDRKLHELEGRLLHVEKQIHHMSIGQAKNNEQTAEMYALFTSAKGAFRTLDMIGRAAKPLLWIGALVSAIVMGVKTGVWDFHP